MVVFDAAMLLYLFGLPAKTEIERPQERVEFLIKTLEKERSRIIIPTPVLSEVLVHAGQALKDILSKLEKSSVFRLLPFDTMAAVEMALITKAALHQGNKRGSGEGTWAKVKFDRQIIAIAKVARARAIYSDDVNLRNFGRECGLEVIPLSACPLPPEDMPLLRWAEGTEQKKASDAGPSVVPPLSQTPTEEKDSER